MLELFKIIREYFARKKLKKLLRRFLNMENSDNFVKLTENEYIIDGIKYNREDILKEITKWARENFIFRSNDVFLPNPPTPLFGSNTLVNHPSLKIENFKAISGVSFHYLAYSIFLIGFDAGRNSFKSETAEFITKRIDEIADKAVYVPTKVEKEGKEEDNKSSTTENDIINSLEEKQNETNNKIDELRKLLEEGKIEPSPIIQNDETENEKLIINSNYYKPKTYEHFISSVIERKLSSFGMTVEDASTSNIPTYIIGELLLEIKNQDAINNEQIEIRERFYNYFKNIQERLSKENTIS